MVPKANPQHRLQLEIRSEHQQGLCIYISLINIVKLIMVLPWSSKPPRCYLDLCTLVDGRQF
jgi:hypothetical protein